MARAVTAGQLVIEDETGAADSRPDFRHVRAWLFDLDNTLYPFGSQVLRDAEQRICRFIEERFHLPREEAWRLQKDCLHENGSTLSGLVKRFGVDPEAYLAFVNDVDVTTLTPAPALLTALRRLPGRRIVFTNNCAHYADRVLKQLGIADAFDGVFDIRSLGFTAKPIRAAYETVLRNIGVAPDACAMFEDSDRNLVPAHALGMTTVWITPPPPERGRVGRGSVAEGFIPSTDDRNHTGGENPHPTLPLSGGGVMPPYVHHHTDDLTAFLNAIEVHSPS